MGQNIGYFKAAAWISYVAVLVSVTEEMANAIGEVFHFLFPKYFNDGRKNEEGENEGQDKECTGRTFWNFFKNVPKSNLYAVIHCVTLFGLLFAGSYVNKINDYDETYQGVSGTTVNVYGAGKTIINKNTDLRVWDGTDVAVPAEENVVSFITTSLVKIPQYQGNCSESRDIKEAHCSTDNDCAAGISFTKGNGITTGKCVNGTCEVTGWCPINYVEGQNGVTTEHLKNLGDYTLHIKNRVNFGITKSNGEAWRANNFVTEEEKYNRSSSKLHCEYDKSEHNQCPYFSVKNIIQSFKDYKDRMGSDATIAISITLNYKCDYTDDVDSCLPTYDIKLLDQANTPLTHSYTYAEGNNNVPGTNRTLFKANGTLFLIETNAKLTEFSSSVLMESAASAFVMVKSTKPISQLLVALLLCCKLCIKNNCKKCFETCYKKCLETCCKKCLETCCKTCRGNECCENCSEICDGDCCESCCKKCCKKYCERCCKNFCKKCCDKCCKDCCENCCEKCRSPSMEMEPFSKD